MPEIKLLDPELAAADAKLLIAAAADMELDILQLEREVDQELDQAKGEGRGAYARQFHTYQDAFMDLARAYRRLGNKTHHVIRDTVDTDREARLLWDRTEQSSERHAIT